MPVRIPLSSAAATLVVVTVLLAWHGADPAELPVRDAAMRSLANSPARATVIVAIDEASVRSSPWPWSREHIAQLVDRVAASGAKGLVLDILLAEARSGDDQLAASLRRIPSVLVSTVDERGSWLLPVAPLPGSATLAHGNFERDHDGIVRRVSATKQTHDRSLAALSVEAAALLRPVAVPIGRTVAPAFRTPPAEIPVVSASALLREPSRGRRLAGKLVFIGPTALAIGDRVLTPVSGELPDPGVIVQAAATESLLRGETIRELPPIVSGLIAAAAVALAIDHRRSRRTRATIALLLVVLITGGGFLLLAVTGVAPPFVTLSAVLAIGALTGEAASVAGTLRRSHAAATRLESRLGMPVQQQRAEVAPRLEQVATRLAEVRAMEAESKRILAHELKTPLASMRSLTQLLAGFTLTEAERTRVVSLLESEAGKLQSMVTALLDLERVPLRDFETSSATIDLADLAARRVDFLRAGTTRQITATCDPEVLVRGEASLIERSIDNLVANALKYTTGSIGLSVLARNGSAVLRVEDEGPGLAEGERERVFQRFFRASTAAGTDGLGLGLALVAEVARWHGGNAFVEPAPSGGSRFGISFPLLSQPAGGTR